MENSTPTSKGISHDNLPQAVGKIWDEVLKMRTELSDLKQNFEPKTPNEYLTRAEVAKMFSIDLSTVHNYCVKGKLKAYGIGSRVYFLRSEIESALKAISPKRGVEK